MERFVQLHILTSYPPANLNRDDLGRPKTAVVGGKTRLRTSSQSNKRAWRKSDVFEEKLKGSLGTRTKQMGVEIYKALLDKKVPDKKAKEWAKEIAGVFGKMKSPDKKNPLTELEVEQLVHFGVEEMTAINDLVDRLAKSGKGPAEKDLEVLRKLPGAVDIAMFGRMLAAKPAYNVEAAVQVAHGITVHEVAVEDDYFTAVDDLNTGEEDQGAGHIGEAEFGAGVFYLYVCVDRNLLRENLGGNGELSGKALEALVEAAAKVGPRGKQSSFASRAYASYILAEKGNLQPRSLSVAFLKPVRGEDLLQQAISALETTRDNMEKVYGPCASGKLIMNAKTGAGSFKEIIDYVKG
jgi:CRISPR system Cascade subunit CasC